MAMGQSEHRARKAGRRLDSLLRYSTPHFRRCGTQFRHRFHQRLGREPSLTKSNIATAIHRSSIGFARCAMPRRVMLLSGRAGIQQAGRRVSRTIRDRTQRHRRCGHSCNSPQVT